MTFSHNWMKGSTIVIYVNEFLQIETNSGGFLELVLVTTITSKIFLHSSAILCVFSVSEA